MTDKLVPSEAKSIRELLEFTALNGMSVEEVNEILTEFKNKLNQKEEEIEVQRMQLVACGVGAMSNTRESAHNNRVNKDSPYWCASVGDVYTAVDREIDLRESLTFALENLDTALDRIGDMLKGDDGQAYKEAEKFFYKYRSTKNCLKCGSETIPLRSEDKKLCSNGACGHEMPWPLEEGQKYMHKRDVEAFVEDRSGSPKSIDE